MTDNLREITYNNYMCFSDRCEFCNRKVESGFNDLISVVANPPTAWDICKECKARWIKYGLYLCDLEDYPQELVKYPDRSYLTRGGH